MPKLLFKKVHTSPDLIISLFLFLFTFVVAGSFARIGIDSTHDGIMLKPALDVTRGFMLFRDSFTMYGALATLIQAGAFIVFGKYLLTLKLLTAAFYGGIAVFQYLIYKRILPRALAFLTVILWLFVAPYFFWPFLIWSSVYALFFQVAAVYLCILWLEKKQTVYLFFTGVATSCIFYNRPTVGFFTGCSILAFFVILHLKMKLSLKHTRNDIVRYICGIIVVSLFFTSWLGINHSLSDWWKQSFELSSLYATQFHSIGDLLYLLRITFFPLSNPIFVTSPVELWVLLPSTTIVVFVQYIFFRKKESQHHRSLVLLLTLTALASWAQYYPMIDYRHIYWGSTPMFGVLTIFCFELIRYIFSFIKKNSLSLATILTIVGLCILFYPDISSRIIQGKEKLSMPYETLTNPIILKGTLVTAGEKQYITDFENSVTAYLETHPKGTVLNLGSGLYPTLNDHVTSIPPLYVYWSQFMGSVYPDFLPRVSSYIAVHHPLIITSRVSYLPSGYCQLKALDPVYGDYLALPCSELY